MNYLHSQTPAVVHGDIRLVLPKLTYRHVLTDNQGKVILNELDQAVLCDPGLFGISLAEGSYKTVKTNDTSDNHYLAPELLKEDQNGYPTRATDVYALGCLGFEVQLVPCFMR